VRSKNTIFVSLTAVFAALYAVGVVVLGPISFLPIQVRVADALLPLAIVFGWPAILGLSIGAFVANFFGGLGAVDIIGGSLANFIATFVAWRIGRHRSKPWQLLGVGLEIVVITLIVGTYLTYVFGFPLAWVGVFVGSVIAIGILGSILLFTLSRKRVTSMLKPYGIGPESESSKVKG
jgi:uncharacterized membrane protein